MAKQVRINHHPGERYGKLTLIKKIGTHNKPNWRCKCDCGNEKDVRISDLRSGRTSSCGCVYKESRGKATITHGQAKSLTYKVWCAIIHRTTNKKAANWAIYGGRGIQMCDRWRNSFEAFLEDMGERPSRKYSIDRIDNDGNYEPGNCRWATRKEQRENQSVSRYAHIVVDVGDISEADLRAKTPAVVDILEKVLPGKLDKLEFDGKLRENTAIFKLDKGVIYRPITRKQGNVKEGQKYNQLTAVKYLGIDEARQRIWKWKCDCGAYRTARASRVRYGEIRDCGWGCGLRK